MSYLPPVDQARVGRIVIAHLDGDRPTAESVVAEAVADDRLPELLDAALVALIAFLRRVAGDDGAKQWASDWILHAHKQTHEPSTDGGE